MDREHGVDWTGIFAALANDRRRELLRYLVRMDEPIGLNDATDYLLDADPDADPDPEVDLNRLSVALHHGHIPKLADAGLVTWDPDEKEVTVTPLAKRLSIKAINPSGSATIEALADERASD